MSSSRETAESKRLLNTQPGDIDGLSALNYERQAASGADPLKEHGEVAPGVIRAIADDPWLTTHDLHSHVSLSMSALRATIRGLIDDGVLVAKFQGHRSDPRKFALTDEFLKSDLWEAARLYQREHGDD